MLVQRFDLARSIEDAASIKGDDLFIPKAQVDTGGARSVSF
jgi:hypothetical protein